MIFNVQWCLWFFKYDKWTSLNLASTIHKISLPFPELWCPNHSTGSRSKSSGALPLGSCLWDERRWSKGYSQKYTFPKQFKKKVEVHHMQPQHGVYYLINQPEVVHFCRIALSLWGSSRFRSLTQYQWRIIYCKIWITSSFHPRWFDLYGHTYQYQFINKGWFGMSLPVPVTTRILEFVVANSYECFCFQLFLPQR